MVVDRNVKSFHLAEAAFERWSPDAPIGIMLNPIGCDTAYETFTVKEAKAFMKEIKIAVREAKEQN